MQAIIETKFLTISLQTAHLLQLMEEIPQVKLMEATPQLTTILMEVTKLVILLMENQYDSRITSYILKTIHAIR